MESNFRLSGSNFYYEWKFRKIPTKDPWSCSSFSTYQLHFFPIPCLKYELTPTTARKSAIRSQCNENVIWWNLQERQSYMILQKHNYFFWGRHIRRIFFWHFSLNPSKYIIFATFSFHILPKQNLCPCSSYATHSKCWLRNVFGISTSKHWLFWT